MDSLSNGKRSYIYFIWNSKDKLIPKRFFVVGIEVPPGHPMPIVPNKLTNWWAERGLFSSTTITVVKQISSKLRTLIYLFV